MNYLLVQFKNKNSNSKSQIQEKTSNLQPYLIVGVKGGRCILQELPCPPPGVLPNPGIETRSPELQADSLPAEPQGQPANPGVGSLSLLQWIFPTQGLDSLPTELSGRPKLLIILFIFIFGYAGSSLLFSSGGVWVSRCGDFSCCGPQALECVDFSSCGTWTQ